jgi:gliding motility-associated lipoprotein GldH
LLENINKKKMKKIAAIVVMSIFMVGCSPEGRDYSEYKELSPMEEWLKKDVIVFKVPIEKENQEYNMSLAYRYVVGHNHEIVKVKITETTPSGKVESVEHDLNMLDENGYYKGDGSLGIIDTEHLIVANKIFKEKGTYNYKIEHMMPNDPVEFAIEIGVILDKIK